MQFFFENGNMNFFLCYSFFRNEVLNMKFDGEIITKVSRKTNSPYKVLSISFGNGKFTKDVFLSDAELQLLTLLKEQK